MNAQKQRRWPSSLALQVSPCITLGILLVASLGARAAGLPCDLSACLQRVASQAEQSATVLSGTEGHDRLQLFGAPQAAIETAGYGLAPLNNALAEAPAPQPRVNCQHFETSQPRAP